MKMKSHYLLILIIMVASISSRAAHDKEEKSLYHVLLFQWTEGISQNDKSELLDLFKGLTDKVKGYETIEIRDLTMSSEEYDIVLILQFNSEEDLKEYESHSDHKKIADMGPSLVSKFEVYDYWK